MHKVPHKWLCIHMVTNPCACFKAPTCRIWLYTMGHSTEVGYAQWAIAKNLAMRHGPRRRLTRASFEGIVRRKIVHLLTQRKPPPPML